MSCRGKKELCLICGGPLRGNQRRWLFGGHGKKNGPPETPPGARPGGGGLSRSSQSSPWGSTLSLGSSASLSRSQVSLSSASKAVDLLAVLTHILGRAVPRGGQQGEFVCGKCVCVLERVFKFDSVISRVRVLSGERLQKLTEERDKIRQWVRLSYQRRHPGQPQNRGSTSEEEGAEAEKEGYREMLRENMELSEYECWSERWDTCPYFIRTGKRCRKGKGCEGCDSLRVSDSDYESVCGVPRHLPFQPFSPLSRDKSRSMPLHWHRASSVSSSPASLAGSTLSLRASSRASSRAGSVQSLDSLDGTDPSLPPPWDRPLDLLLKELRAMEGKALSSPSGSRIPVLGRKEGRSPWKPAEVGGPEVSRTLSFGDEEENGVEERDGEEGDVLTELRDEFMPLHRESSAGRVHQAIRHLRGQLDQALSRVRTLEEELKQGRSNKPPQVNGSEQWAPLVQEEGGSSLLQSLASSLHSRERLVQECLAVIRSLCVDEGTGTRLTQQLTGTLKEILSDNKAALEALRSEMGEKGRSLEKEVEALRRAGRDRDRDLDTLNTVLQCNQDVINDLRGTLGEKEQQLKEVEKERELWRQRDGALAAVLQEKEVLIRDLKELLELSPGGGAELATWLEEREGDSATLCQEVTKLTTALQEYQDMVQSQQESHSRVLSSLSDQLREARLRLHQNQKEERDWRREQRHQQEDREREERRLRDSLDKRDKLLERILQDAEERELLIRELQQNKREPVTAVKHTL